MQPEAPRWLIQHQGAGILRLESRDARSSELRRYHVQKERLVAPFGRTLPPLLEDLVDLAVTVYAADRLIRRRSPGASKEDRCWQRDFEIELPVVDPEHWSRPEVRHRLTDLLGFLTEDRWEFRFVPRVNVGETGGAQSVLLPPEPPVGAALFSGGLDSLAGLANDLTRSDLSTLLVLTCSTNSQLLARQRELLKTLVHQPNVRLIPVVVPLRLRQGRREYNRNERSQRSRGFLFGILGCVASLMAGAPELSIYENGVGAINRVLPARLAPLWDMLGQVEKLDAALGSPRPWSSLAVEFPELLETRDIVRDWLSPTPRAAVEQKLTALYRSYCHEWHEFPARPPGWTSSRPEYLQTA